MTAERFALDTNVLIYLVDGCDPARQARAREVAERAVLTGRCSLSLQSLGEFFVVAVRKGLATPAVAQQTVDDLATASRSHRQPRPMADGRGRRGRRQVRLLGRPAAGHARAGWVHHGAERGHVGDGGISAASLSATRSRATVAG